MAWANAIKRTQVEPLIKQAKDDFAEKWREQSGHPARVTLLTVMASWFVPTPLTELYRPCCQASFEIAWSPLDLIQN